MAKKDKKQYSGFLGDCSKEQLEMLDRVRDQVKNKMKIDDPRYNDWYLLRFCRARKFNFDKIMEMFKNFIEWRIKNEADVIANKDVTYIKKIDQIYRHGYYGVDKIGRPIYIERYKDFDLKSILALVTEEQLFSYFVYGYEKLLHVIFPACTEAYGSTVERSVTILDLKGMNFSKVISKRKEITRFVKIASGIAQNNYPEIMGKMFVVNTPFLFKMLWGVVKSFIDKKTLKKISILGSNYLKQISKEIDIDQLPHFLKGNNIADLDEGSGPWSKYEE